MIVHPGAIDPSPFCIACRERMTGRTRAQIVRDYAAEARGFSWLRRQFEGGE